LFDFGPGIQVLVGHAVTIAPVSRQIPCKQGILQAKAGKIGIPETYSHRNALNSSLCGAIPYRREQGKQPEKQAILALDQGFKMDSSMVVMRDICAPPAYSSNFSPLIARTSRRA
jgi:hypothetical protein